jgi:hypothetical protein
MEWICPCQRDIGLASRIDGEGVAHLNEAGRAQALKELVEQRHGMRLWPRTEMR